MDAERQVLSKAIQAGKLDTLVSKGVDTDYFHNKECQEVWDTCLGHIRKYKSQPSLDAVRTKHPDFSFELSTDAFDYIYDKFVFQTKRRKTMLGMRAIAKVIDSGDPEAIQKIDEQLLLLGNRIARLFPEGSAARFSEMEERIALYEERKDSGVTIGIPFGIEKFDDVTQGIRRHEFVSIAGWQGTGKSTLGLHTCFNAYLAGFTPLIISLEMENDAIFEKLDIMATNFKSEALRKYELGELDLKKWREWSTRAANASNDIVCIDNVSNCTVEKVQSIAEQYAPDLLVVDYISLMETPNGNSPIWEKVTYLTQRLKAIARDPAMPAIMGIVQTNAASVDEGAKLETISYSRSIGQDSDIVIGLYQDKDGKMKSRHEMEVRMLKNRRGPICDAKMYWNPEVGEHREWRLTDMFGDPDDGSSAGS